MKEICKTYVGGNKIPFHSPMYMLYNQITNGRYLPHISFCGYTVLKSNCNETKMQCE